MPQLEFATYLSQLFWLFISFGLLYLLLSKVCLPQLSGIISQRDAKIATALQNAQQAKDEAHRLRDEYEASLADALKSKNQKIADMTKEISAMIDKKMKKQDEQIAELLHKSEKKLADFSVQSQDNIHKTAQEVASSILTNVIGIEASNEIIAKSLQEEIKKIEASHV